APFRELLGLHVEDFLPLSEAGIEVRFADGTADRSEIWSELVRLRGAQALATFAAGTLDGEPAATRHGFGDGSAYYLATRLAPAAMSQLLRRIWQEAGVRPVADAPAGVEAVRRRGGESLLFLLNHGQQPVEVSTTAGALELISGARLPSDRLQLAPREVAIIREPA